MVHSNPVVGRWAGDRVVLAGDEGKLSASGETMFEQCLREAAEISARVKEAMLIAPLSVKQRHGNE
jgi:hypothetical protein